ncbi:Cytochrome C oxidase, cbb3-type, subunit III [compost metagenome]
MKKIALLLLLWSTASCSLKHEVACNADDSKAVVVAILRADLIKQITADYTRQASTATSDVDGASIRATVEKIAIELEDVLTTKSDPNSTRKFCGATLKLNVPIEVVRDADATRSMMSLNSSRQSALQVGVDFDGNMIKAPVEYSVQSTDDGKKVLSHTESKNLGMIFTSSLVEQSLMKVALETQKATHAMKQQQAALEAQRRQVVIDQALAAENQAALEKAKADIKAANDAINVVWNAGTKEWRQELLPEQRLWIAQRASECKIKALENGTSGSTEFEVNRLKCEVIMTIARTDVLKDALKKGLSQPSVPVSNSNVLTPVSAEIGRRVYEQVCAACHATGVAGAPKFGDRAAWAPRINTGMDVVRSFALKGKGVMPPKGGYGGPDADVIAASDYMANAVR